MRTTFGTCIIGLFVFFPWMEQMSFSIHTLNNQQSTINNQQSTFSPPDTTDTLHYPVPQDDGTGFFPPQSHPLYLDDPSVIKDTIIYDAETNEYISYRKIGNYYYRMPQTLSFDEYYKQDFDRIIMEYWRERNKESTEFAHDRGIIPQINIRGQLFESIFGSSTIDIRPQGSAELIFGVISSSRDDPALNVKQQRTTNFDFQQKIQMNVTAKVGEKINFAVKYNTEASFEFENEMKLKYEGDEDEIIKSLEAGNVTLPLNSTLITGSQSLFGIKSELQFGKTYVTTVISQQKGESSTITVSGGAQMSEYELMALDYEENRHFFVSQFFRDNYNKFLQKLPIVSSPVNINKMEVWVTNIGHATTENRNIVAFMDLGEYAPYNPGLNPTAGYHFPHDSSNNLLINYVKLQNIRNLNDVASYLNSVGIPMTSGIDYEKVENARLLRSTEYTYNDKLGFISLNTRLNPDQVLSIAYQYTVVGSDKVYQVGEFSAGGIAAPQCIAVKLLKSTAVNTKIPLWKLMLKNVYAIGGFRINPEDFQLHVLYKDNKSGIPMGYLTEGGELINGVPLIRVLNMDNLNTQGDPEPDGIFDFMDNAATMGGTIQSSNGRVFFPILEPFGSDLRKKIGDQSIADKYCFDSLYTMTKTEAMQYPNKNRFIIMGTYKSASGSEISLNAMNVPQGSVRVTAGGIPLTENVDYTVDYTLGRVRIINEGILNSGTPISISLESQSLFAIQTKTLLGTNIEHRFNPNLTVGGTIMNLTERPLTTKVNFGNEPISNTIWGMNVSYQTEAPIITAVLDKLPFLSTTTPSNINIDGEFAHLIPGQSKAINGTSYIDDFEGTKSSMDIKNVGRWFLASVPKEQPLLFPEAGNDSTIVYGFNRASLSWYVIDPLFHRNNNLTPNHIKNDKEQQSNHFVREVLETEVFPFKEPPHGLPLNIAVLNLTYYPDERGPYNFDASPTSYSAGLNNDGKLNAPHTRWAGIMRNLETTDFEETNIEYIEFWMMDPFVYNQNHAGGRLIFNIGDISEDVLHDNRKSFENGLPVSAEIVNIDTTQWGRVPNIQAIVNAFDSDPVTRQYQDVGLDGLSTTDEKTFYKDNYLDVIESIYGATSIAYQLALQDPSKDNYKYFRGSQHDANATSILERYKYFNNMEGNSPTDQQSPENYPTSSTTLPNTEDINRDNTLTTAERYYQYVIDLHPAQMNIGENYIADYFDAQPKLANGSTATVRWYQFRIPVRAPDARIGNIQDFKSIRFMRMFLRGFQEQTTLRFATLDLVRSQWRRYDYSLLSPGEYIPNDEHNQTSFDISAVNIEENGNRTPIPYVLPPDIERELDYGTTAMQQMNEQSLSLRVCHLVDGDARAVYKTTDFDLRRYKRLKMFVHAEETNPDNNYTFDDGDLTLFIRLGTDFSENYYEYEIPLYPTQWDVGYDREKIWPEDIQLDLELQEFVELKKRRNVLLRDENSDISLTKVYTIQDGRNRISVIGSPSLSDVQTIMLGVRNPKKQFTDHPDDSLPKCAEIWVNELRIADFDNKGGGAAMARVSANLADLGNISLAGMTSTAGFGSIEQKVNERQMENITSYDIATNLQLGKFLPEKTGLRIPMHFDISETFSNPQYNPLNPDVIFRDDVNALEDKEDRDSLRYVVQDYTKRKSINFMNVSKVKTGSNVGKSRFYDVENLDLSYAYTELYNRNIDIEYSLRKTYLVGLGYNFQNNPKNYTPFSKVKFLTKYKSLSLIKDFNYFLMLKSVSVRNDINRQYQEQMMRNKTEALIIIEPTFMKTFNWNRFYNIKYDFSRSLKFDFTANAMARIDEPPGRINKDDPDYKEKRDSIITNLMDFGRLTVYNHNYSVNYNVPINKIPILNWLNLGAQYSGDYRWTASPLYKDSLGNYVEHPYANTIENNHTKQVNAGANMNNLYNKVKYLRNLNQPQRQAPKPKPQDPSPKPQDNEEEKEEEKIDYVKLILDNSLKFLMGIKNVSGSFSQSEGTLMPGFKPTPSSLGMDWKNDAPGLGFIFGSQEDIRDRLGRDGLLTKDTLLNIPFATKFNQMLNFRATIEPIKDLRVELTANRSVAINRTEYYRFSPADDAYKSYSPVESGNFSVSIITWSTAFIRDADDFSNANFEKFRDLRPQVAEYLANQNPHWDGIQEYDTLAGRSYPRGYNSTSQDVLITSFLSAYTGQDITDFSNDPFVKIPKPNWRINYNGLSKVPLFKRYFKTVTLMHAYRSNLNIGSFVGNINFKDTIGDGFTWVRDQGGAGNFISRYEIGQISISEQFSPLLNIDVRLQNDMTSRIEFKKSRNLSLGLANHQLTEVTSNEFIFGVGYIFKDVLISIKSGGTTRTFKSDLTVKADFSIRNNKNILRKVVENYDQISSGQRIITINTSADYQLSPRFTIRLFFDRIMNRPYVSSQFPNRNTSAGISIRFSLAQ